MRVRERECMSLGLERTRVHVLRRLTKEDERIRTEKQRELVVVVCVCVHTRL